MNEHTLKEKTSSFPKIKDSSIFNQNPPSYDGLKNGSNHHRISSSHSDNSKHCSYPTTPKNDDILYFDSKKLEKSVKEDIAGNYFIKPKRAAELLNQSRVETSKVFNTWRGKLTVPEFTKRNKTQTNDLTNGNINPISPNGLSQSYGGISSLWLNGSVLTPEATFRRPLRLEALPTVEKRRKSHHKLNTLDLL